MEHDLLKRWIAGSGLAAAIPLPPAVASAAGPLLDFGGLAVIGMLLGAFVGALTAASSRTTEATPARRLVDGLVVASGLAAVALLGWLVRHPSPGFDQLFRRWDHLAFCALAGVAMLRAPAALRRWLLTVLSLGLLVQHSGLLAVGVAIGAGLAGFLVLRTPVGSRRWANACLQATILAAAYAFCLWLRGPKLLEAMRVQGLLAWVALRHISAVVEASRGVPVPLGGYLTYLSIYPGSNGLFAGPEVYAEFARRNLGPVGAVDHRLAVRRIVKGGMQAWLAQLVPITTEQTLASTSTPEVWGNSLLLFVRTALAVMGGWAMIEGAALFLGVRLRPNFAGLLSCQTPSALWRSWRGTMTNWLVQHVYVPLGANRRHQSLNVLAAFGASLAWHLLSVPFVGPDFHLAKLAPITTWAVVNAIAVVAHIQVQRRAIRPLPGATPEMVRRGMKLVLVAALGSLAVTLPEFQGARIEAFPGFVRLLLGLPR